MEFSTKDVATYYNHTVKDYQIGWQLNKSKGLHLGLWYDDTKNLHEAIVNTNKKIGEYLPGSKDLHVLDAGCGVGGTAIYLAQHHDCHIEGVTLSPKQYRMAERFVRESGMDEKVSISIQDYTTTDFPDQSFDMVFGLESICHANDKPAVYREVYRLLKPGGRFVIIDIFKTGRATLEKNRPTLEWLLRRWAISDYEQGEETQHNLTEAGFTNIKSENLTSNILKSVKIMWLRALFGVITIPLYTLIHPTNYVFSRRHPESGWALRKCVRKKLIDYLLIYSEKPV
ncbi:MAG: methyltransferase domain-containing protein [Bacteroidales bacterium]|nr:methyltransferase domain-containing protein [Bacteroidales bacterium]